MDSDIYWSHVCINALKFNDFNIFYYGIQYINNINSINILNTMRDKVKNNDVVIIEKLRNYICPFPIHIA